MKAMKKNKCDDFNAHWAEHDDTTKWECFWELSMAPYFFRLNELSPWWYLIAKLTLKSKDKVKNNKSISFIYCGG